jgi:exopolysaccharide production protein ExoQ
MPRSLAILLSLLFIAWLWRKDHQQRRELSPAIWIPVIWLMVLGSRPLSFWFGFTSSGGSLEGNAFDRTFYLVQILISMVILARRQFPFGDFSRNNTALFLFYAWLLLTLFWSGYPFVTFKRWFKEIGGIFVMLLILTEKNPMEALKAVYIRCAYVLIPLSVLFIKYVPEFGRAYTNQGGVMYCGVTEQKNSLGEIVLIFSLILIWDMVQSWDDPERKAKRKGFFYPSVVILMGLYCLQISDSKTAMICLVAGTVILVSHRLPLLRTSPTTVFWLCLLGGPTFLGLDKLFKISNTLLAMIGRDSTFTGRTEIWRVVREHPVNPLLGSGYLAYWDKTGVVEIGDYEAELKTAHNGYLEIYLDGGFIALGLLLLVLLVLAVGIYRNLKQRHHFARLQFAFFLVTVLYNFSESTFARRGPLWFSFVLIAVTVGSLLWNHLLGSEQAEDGGSEEAALPEDGSAFGDLRNA